MSLLFPWSLTTRPCHWMTRHYLQFWKAYLPIAHDEERVIKIKRMNFITIAIMLRVMLLAPGEKVLHRQSLFCKDHGYDEKEAFL